MKSFAIRSLCFAMLSMLLICSCKEDEEVALGNDCYISSFTLGNVKRYFYGKTAGGEDTTYTISYSASYFPMTINQLDATIANRDSLPVNTDVRAVLASIESPGTVVYRKENEGEESWRSYSSSDSIDFTVPLIFRVFSPDNTACKDYRTTVNVHRQDGEVFTWRKLTSSDLWTSAQTLKAFVWGNQLCLLARTNEGDSLLVSSLTDGAQWAGHKVSGCDAADFSTLTLHKGKFYMSGTDGSLLMSEDARNWSVLPSVRKVHLLASDGERMHALSERVFWHSADGTDWTEDLMESHAVDSLPQQDFASVSYTQDDGQKRMLLVGNHSVTSYPKDTHAMVWNRLISDGARWTYFNVSADNSYACPRLASLNVVRYNNVLLAMGGASLNGTAHTPLDNLYVSEDNGLTWKVDGVYTLPQSLRGQNMPLTSVVDDQYYLWLIVGGEVWRGRLNELGFAHR